LVISPVTLHTWATIAAVVVTATAGDILIAYSMRSLDLDAIRARSGMAGAIRAVVTAPSLIFGIVCMALSFFSLLFALSGADLSLIAPATASLTFVTTAVAAKVFLHENVDRRRWLAALFVCTGVALLAR
jgi:drug/metabolite transporter (DMT)-like permease